MNDEQIMRPNPTIKKIFLYRDPIDFLQLIGDLSSFGKYLCRIAHHRDLHHWTAIGRKEL